MYMLKYLKFYFNKISYKYWLWSNRNFNSNLWSSWYNSWKNVVWTSDNEKVATVKDGVITTLKPGTANIKATVDGKEATCALTVNPVPLNSISIKEQNITLEKGKTSNLTVTYNPETTTDDKTVTWSSDADDIVSVDNGVITAKKQVKLQ